MSVGERSEEKTALLRMSARAGNGPGAVAPVVDEPATSRQALTGPTMPMSASRPPGESTGGGVGSPIEALERDEILRTRSFCFLVILLAAIGSLTALFLPGGDPLGEGFMLAGCGLAVGAMVFVLNRTRDPVRFRQASTSFAWFLPALAVNTANAFFGVFSPAPMLVVLGLYFVGLGKSGWLAVAAYVLCAVATAALGLVVILGGRDIGLMHPDMSTTQRIVILACEEVVMAVTIVIARMSRQTALLAVGELERAVRLAAHRQALLLEARDELDRAMRSKRGRFSEQVLGSYQLGEILGRGAMGEVYAATDRRSGARVAVKLLSHASLGNADHVLRFLRELRTAATVRSPHVVEVLEIGESPLPHLVMERLEGETLAGILRERRTLPIGEVVELVSQVGSGIAAAKESGIVHRDLKPQNVFRHLDTWKVLDFGVARAIDQGDTLTAGQIVGTPSYMSPEQANGDTVDHRTDLYALAAIAYRALTGHPPFVSSDVAETLYRVVHTRPMRPSLLAPELPGDVDLVLAIGMAPRPEDRFASGAELAAALRDAGVGNLAQGLRAAGGALVNATGWSTVGRARSRA